MRASDPRREPHPRQDASHIGEAGNNAWHRIIGTNLILQIDEAGILYCDEGFKHLSHWHNAIPHGDLALLALEVREVLHVYIEQSRAGVVDSLHHVRAGANRMPDIDAASYARIHTLHHSQYIQRRMPQPILRTVIVNRDAYVVLLYELLHSRQSFRRRIAGDNDRNTRSLAVFEFGSDVRILVFIFIFREVDGAGCVKLDAR